MWKIFLKVFILTILLFCASCGYKTPGVSNFADIQKLDKSTKWIRGRGLSDEAMLHLGRIKGAEYIDLCGGYLAIPFPNITDKGFENLAKISNELPNLRKIEICTSDLITDKCLYWLSRTQYVEKVFITNCPKITNQGFEYLSKNNNIKGIAAVDLERIDNTTLQHLKEMPNLEELDLAGSNFINTESMVLISRFEKIHVLLISADKSPNFTDASLKELSKSNTIEHLEITINENITSDGIESLANIKTLKLFFLYNCTTKIVNNDLFAKLYTSLPNCVIMFSEGQDKTLYRYEPSGDKYIRPDLIPSAED